MKNFNSKTIIVICIAVTALIASGCSKKSHVEAPKGETKIERLCDVKSDKDHLRVSAFAESVNRAQAEKKSLNNARTQLAAQLNTTVKTMVDNFTQSAAVNIDEEYNELFKSLQRDIINANFSYITLCNELTQKTDGKYVSYVGLELAGDELWKEINTRLPKDDKMRIEYDYERFKKEFEEEMKKIVQ